MLFGKYWTAEEVYDRTADMTDICLTTHPYTPSSIIHQNECHFSQSVLWHSHVTYTFYFSPFLKQTLKIAKNLASKLPLHPNHENTPYLYPVSIFIHLVSPFFCFHANGRYRQLSTTRLASPRFVLLVVIAMWRSRDQIWPVGRDQIWPVGRDQIWPVVRDQIWPVDRDQIWPISRHAYRLGSLEPQWRCYK